MEKLITALLYRSGVFQVSENDLHLQLQSHKEYPSLKSVTDSLDYFGIENIAAKVPTEGLDRMPDHFLALINSDATHGIDEMVFVQKKKGKLYYSTTANKKIKTSPSHFTSIWTGTVVAVEEQQQKGTSAWAKQLNFNTLAAVLIFTIAFTLWTISGVNLLEISYGIISLVGIVASYYVSKEDLGIKDQLTAKVCGVISKNTDGCSTVINSKEGKVFDQFGLGDLSMVYFIGLFLLITLTGFNNSFLYTLSLCTLPVILFSYYLQAFKLKQWCLLCLVISFVLLSQFAVLQLTFTVWDFSLHYTITAILIAVVTGFSWFYIKKLWKDRLLLQATRTEYYKFKRTKEFFFQALKKKDPYSVSTLDPQINISFGRKEAPIKIFAVTNPLCGFCQEPFMAYDSLLSKYPQDVQLNVIFNVPTDTENKANQISSTIIGLYQKNEAEAYDALKAWFKDKNVETWQSTYGISPVLFMFPKKVIQAHLEWCVENSINYTPETIINGYSFPREEYKIDDLQYFIEDIKELINTTEIHISA